jgi:hypothetical protein
LVVVVLGGEQEHAELGAVESSCVGWVDLRAADVLGWVRSDPAVDVGEAVEAAHRERRRSIVDAASWRSSIQARNSSMCGRVAFSTSRWLSAAHWKNPRRSWRYASSVRPKVPNGVTIPAVGDTLSRAG